MTGNELLILSDKNIIPTDDLIFSLIGDKKVFWQLMMKSASEIFTDVSGSWNYYNDGKQWLFKLVSKKKTILWAAIQEDTFRVTFWFGDKAQDLIESSVLPGSVKQGFRTAKRYGAIRAVTIKMEEQADIDNIAVLLTIKQQIK
jgi:hypothetical protein